MISLKEVNQLNWVHAYSTIPLNATLVPAKAGHRGVIYVLRVMNNSDGSTGHEIGIIQNDLTAIAVFAGGRGNSGPLYCKIENPKSNDNIKFSAVGPGGTEFAVVAGYTYEPVGEPRK